MIEKKEKLLTADEVAERLDVSAQQILRLIRAGRLVAIDVGCRKGRRTLRIRPEDLEAYLTGATVAPPAPRVSSRQRRQPHAVVRHYR